MNNKLPSIWTINMRKRYFGIRPVETCFPLPEIGELLTVTDGKLNQQVVVTAVDEEKGTFDVEEQGGEKS